jgi:translation initiation factor 5B
MTKIRSPVCTVMGHVDHGKTSILDLIRGTAVAKGEAGGITQSISSTNLQIETIKTICGDLLKKLRLKITLPGILFIDSPGHAAFTNLRKRGGNLADIGVLVIDINEGIKPQTIECIEILKQYKTPFIIAANKIDLIPGWNTKAHNLILENINKQNDKVKEYIDIKIYEIVGKLHELGLNSERFDRVEDYTKQIAIVPVSAKTGEGLPELLMVLTGLAQKFLEICLKCDIEGPGKGIILEVKEEKGLGTTLDVILYDGHLKKNDQIVIGDLKEPIVTKIKALFEPGKKKLKNINKVHAAIGVKISAPNIKNVISGMPLIVANKNLDEAKKEIQEEVEEVLIETDNGGIVIKADSLGSLEALINLLKEKEIKIKKASVGNISKKDIAEASSEKDELNKVILGFNVGSVESKEVKIIKDDVIYKIIEKFEKWKEDEERKIETKKLQGLVKPCKMYIMPNYVFRQSNPAVVGAEILEGVITNTTPLMKSNGNKVGSVGSLQSEGENIQKAKKGEQVAVAIPGITVGRQINEGEILYSDIPEEDFIKYKQLKKFLNREVVSILKEVAEIKRKNNPVWGV